MFISAAPASVSPLRALSTRIERVDDMARGGAFPPHEAAAPHAIPGPSRPASVPVDVAMLPAISGKYEKRFHGG